MQACRLSPGNSRHDTISCPHPTKSRQPTAASAAVGGALGCTLAGCRKASVNARLRGGAALRVPGVTEESGRAAWQLESDLALEASEPPTQADSEYRNRDLTFKFRARPGSGPVTDQPEAKPLQLQVATVRRLTSGRRGWSAGDRHSSRPRAGRSLAIDIRIECSAVYTLRCIFMIRIISRDNNRFVSHGFCH